MSYHKPPARYTPEEYRQRPREFDPELADRIIERVANGDFLPVICADRDMPLPGTFLTWCNQDLDLERRYLQARHYGVDVVADDVVVQAMHPDAAVAGARSRAMQWFAERMNPDKFSPRAVVRNTESKERDVGGIDYAAEVRRKLDIAAKNLRKEGEAQAGATSPED